MSYEEEEQKISITGLIREVFRNKMTLICFVVAFIGLGLLVYLLSPKEYAASTVVLPEGSSSSNLGGLSGLASLADFNIGKLTPNERTLSPAVYENLIRSAPFLNTLVAQRFFFPSIGLECTLSEFLIEHSEPTFAERIRNIFKGRPSAISTLQDSSESSSVTDSIEATIFSNTIFKPYNRSAISKLDSRIFYEADSRTGLITISLDLQDREVGARLIQEIITQLIEISRRYSGQRDSTSIEQIDRQILQKKTEYETAARRLASFTDQNRQFVFSTDKVLLEQLQNEVSLARSVYTSLLQQREQITIRSEREVAPISIIEPVQVATSAYKPKLFLTFVVSIFLGVFLGTCFILTRKSILTIMS